MGPTVSKIKTQNKRMHPNVILKDNNTAAKSEQVSELLICSRVLSWFEIKFSKVLHDQNWYLQGPYANNSNTRYTVR